MTEEHPDAPVVASADQRRGEIYDLGYRRYDGPRLGRRYALRSLVALSVRSTFGIGRGALPKVLAFGLALLAFVPAIGTVAAGALGGADFELVLYEDYFGLITMVIVLFVAAMSSELVGNDRKSNTLPLYFSRPIERDDYVLAKIASLALALLALTLLPLLLVFIGNWLGADDSTDWLLDNASDLWRIVAASVLACAHLAAIGLAISMFATRRAVALATVIATLLFSLVAVGALVSVLDPGWAAVVAVTSPLAVMEAVTLTVFDAVPPVTALSSSGEGPDQIAYVGLPGWAWITAALAQTALAVSLAIARYRSAAL